MSYVEESLGEGEEIIYEFFISRNDILSWYFGVMLLAFLAGIFWGVTWGVVVGVLLMPLAVMRHYFSLATEKAITNKRIIFKEGLIARETQEQMLSTVEKVEMSQTISQRVNGAGDIKIIGLGGAVMIFENVGNPVDFKKKIESLVETSKSGKS